MNHHDVWLSVLVPAYNADRYVGRCLESIVTQPAHGVEVIVVDDCSTDATATVLAEVRRRHPARLVVHAHARNRGIAATRNHLVNLARGTYLWFMDADDAMLPNAIAALRDIVGRSAPDLVLCDYLRGSPRGDRRGRSFDGPARTIVRDPSTILAGLFEAGQLHPWSKISRRELWSPALRFPEGRVFEDVAVMPRLASRAARVYHEPEPWVWYRKWEGSIVATMNPAKCVDLVRASAEFPADLRRLGLRLSNRALFAARHFAARHFIRAMRHLGAGPDAESRGRARRECLALFGEALEGQTAWLERRYLRQGSLWHSARLRYWMHRARRDDHAASTAA